MFRPKRGSGFSPYRVMVKRQGVLVMDNYVPFTQHTRQLKVTLVKINCYPPCLSLALCLLYSFHSSLVIGMLLCLVGLKECRLVNQRLGMSWPLSDVGSGLEQKRALSSPHQLIFQAHHPDPETENTTLHYTQAP